MTKTEQIIELLKTRVELAWVLEGEMMYVSMPALETARKFRQIWEQTLTEAEEIARD